MTGALRAEMFKLRVTRSTYGMAAGLVGLVAFAVVLHALTVPVERLDDASAQVTVVFAWGERFGALFAALLGALSITGEFRHGTIRPTFLVSPDRRRVVVAKTVAALGAGIVLGVVGALVSSGASVALLGVRGVDVALTAGDHAQFLGGTVVAAALWAAVGVGVGAVVRSQVPALVGLTAWLLLLETLLVEGVPEVGRYLPGAAAQALSGQSPARLLAPGWAALVLALYAVAAVVAGSRVTVRRDVA
jgi:ABC-2 type transport system permease protein